MLDQKRRVRINSAGTRSAWAHGQLGRISGRKPQFAIYGVLDEPLNAKLVYVELDNYEHPYVAHKDELETIE